MQEDKLLYYIALTLLPGVGDILGKKLIALCGGAEAVFREPKRHLKKMPRIGDLLAKVSANPEVLVRAEQELTFIERYRIKPLCFTDPDYPHRLKNCLDSPILLYYKGMADLNAEHIIGIVGTRNATDYGRIVTGDLISGLVEQKVVVVSGLAYGIDSCAHQQALDSGLDTIGVLAHGLDRVYPWLHRPLAEKMVTQGGLVTEFLSRTKPDRANFPRRNRIIAGLCDAIVVVEAGKKGGALITADIANSYNRDVFAIPGRVTDACSEGTNSLIRTNRAALIQNASDLEYMMGWKENRGGHHITQRKIFLEMTPMEEAVVALLQQNGPMGVDDIADKAKIPVSKMSASLLNLEFEGVIKCCPGKVYSLI